MSSNVSRLWIALAIFSVIGCERSGPPGSPAANSETKSAPGAEPVVVGEVVARYDGGALTSEQLTAELGRLPERSRRLMTADARRKFVDNYVLNELLYSEGERQGFPSDPEIRRQVDDLRKRLVVQRVVRNLQDLPPITDEEVKAYYDANPAKFSTSTIKARHILVKDEDKAKELRAQVVADPSKFSELAQASSADTASARKGGDLGYFGHGRMVPEFENAAFALKVGEISEIVKTPYGYHIIVVDEVREGAQKPFDQVKEQIRATMRNQALQARTKDYYEQLRKRANVTVDEAVVEKVAASMPQVEPSPGAAPPLGAFPAGHPPIGGMPAAGH